MKKINQIVKWMMLVSGVATASMFYGVLAPQAALESMFGVSFDGELQILIVRSWSALVGLMGVVLLYGFFNQALRGYSLAVAATSKLIFISLVLLYGHRFLPVVAPAIFMDVIVVLLSLIYFSGTKRESYR